MLEYICSENFQLIFVKIMENLILFSKKKNTFILIRNIFFFQRKQKHITNKISQK